jgi:hypothetical protein
MRDSRTDWRDSRTRMMQVRRPEGYPGPLAVPDEARLVAYRYPHTLDILPSTFAQRRPSILGPANRVTIIGWPSTRENSVAARREEVRDHINPPLPQKSFDTSFLQSWSVLCRYRILDLNIYYFKRLVAVCSSLRHCPSMQYSRLFMDMFVGYALPTGCFYAIFSTNRSLLCAHDFMMP